MIKVKVKTVILLKNHVFSKFRDKPFGKTLDTRP